MRTISIRLADMPKITLNIGFVGENVHTKVSIDCKKIFDDYPDAEHYIMVMPPVGEAYTVTSVKVGDNVEWDVGAADLTSEGNGQMQITFTDNGEVIKSYVAKTHVNESIIPGGGGGGGGTTDYEDLSNKPQIGGVTLVGNKLPSAFGIHSVPAGGSADQVLAKNSATDYDMKWVDQSGGGGGGGAEIDDTAGEGDTDVVWSANKTWTETEGIKDAIESLGGNTPEMYGAVGDGTTDDAEAIQDAIDAGYEVHFASNKTYYIGSTLNIDHDCHLIGGENTVIKTSTPSSGTRDGISVYGTLKKTTTLTGNYTRTGSTDNCGNRFTLSSMTDINIGDLLFIVATDQYYSYARSAYYLGAVLLISDIYDGHIYTSDAMPFDITNTANVTVYVYSAPEAIIENIDFVSDYDGTKTNGYFVELDFCKNAVIRNCRMAQMVKGLEILHSVNTLVDNVTVAKSKYLNSISHDGYGIKVDSSTNTVIQRVMAICSQGCVGLGGPDVPVLNTYIYDCNLFSECRSVGIDLHENSYNLVVEDCVLGGASLYGTAKVNRCRFVQNTRVGTAFGISMRGTHNPDWAEFRITNCEFEEKMPIQFLQPVPQNPIQAFSNIFGLIEIEDCKGGQLEYGATTGATITEDLIKRLSLRRLRDCFRIMITAGNKIEYCEVIGCEFGRAVWMTNTTDGSTFYHDNIDRLVVRSDAPKKESLIVDLKKNGGRYFLPENVPIAFTSSSTGHYVVCGNNIASNKVADLECGSVGGSVGDAMTLTANANFSSALSVDSSGNIVFTQPGNTTGVYIYHKCLAYAEENCKVKMSVKIKNTGATSGAGFRAYLAIVDCATGKITYKSNGDSNTATAEGVTITHTRDVPKNSLVLVFLYCYSAVAYSETTFENFVAKLFSYEDDDTLTYEEYKGSSRDGNGSLNSVEGVNYVMANVSSFDAKFKANLVSNPVGSLPGAVGVSF